MSAEPFILRIPHRADAVVSIHPPALITDQISAGERKQAFDEGYREGFDQAAQSLKQEMLEERNTWEQQLRQVVEQLKEQEEQFANDVEDVLPELILSGIRKVLQTYQPDTDELREIVQDALKTYPREEANLTVLLHPDDCSRISALADSWISQYPGLQFKSDTGLGRGDCLVQGRFGTTDARLSTKLENLRETLSS